MTACLLDLDGTLVDPAQGITRAFRSALTGLGQAPPPAEDLGWIIGPPLRQSFARYLGAGDVPRAVAACREVYGACGLFEARVYDGIPEALAGLKAGARLFVCTAKPTPFARRILQHFGLGGAFDGIYGAELDGRFDDKADLIAHITEREGIRPDESVMIGDRHLDVTAAKANGMRAIGVLWGYGDRDELSQADVLAAVPQDLPPLVF